VTDTTRLDRVGIPVFASVRPNAVPGSLLVSAGKGLSADEARIGAFMEAIELAYAEPSRARVKLVSATARDLLDGRSRPDAAYDFAPRIDARIEPDEPLACVEAVELNSGATTIMPAERVLFPPPRKLVPFQIFGSDGNGLASGNSFDEATVHALAEVIERDVMAFFNLRDSSQRIDNATLPPSLRGLADSLDQLGFDLAVRAQANVFDLPWFVAGIHERGADAPMHLGFGCNPSRDIAATRAVCEAAQARLTVIHGARDDLPGYMLNYAGLHPDERRQRIGRLRTQLMTGAQIAFGDVIDRSAEAADVPDALALLLRVLSSAGFPTVLSVRYTPPESPLQVVRVAVPRLEIFTGGINRMGPRLKDFHASTQSPVSALRGADPAARDRVL
jgi:ribosomal protein S12 methylthiotransferase accessory factor